MRPVSNSLYPLIRDPSEVQDFGQHDVGIRAAINSLWIGIIALFMLIFVIVGAALSTDDLIKVLRSASGKLRALNMDSVTLYMVIAASSVVLVSLAVVIFERAKGMFLFLFLAAEGFFKALVEQGFFPDGVVRLAAFIQNGDSGPVVHGIAQAVLVYVAAEAVVGADVETCISLLPALA